MRTLALRAASGAVGPSVRLSDGVGSGEWWASAHVGSPPCVGGGPFFDPQMRRMSCRGILRIDTPGQAGLPAEFKHINKRRRRNLRGFP